MAETIYRVIYRPIGGEVWTQYKSYNSGDRPYTSAAPAKALATRQAKRMPRYEFKVESAVPDWADL